MDICVSADEQFRREIERLDIAVLRFRLREEIEHARRNLREAEETLEFAQRLVQRSRRVSLGKPDTR